MVRLRGQERRSGHEKPLVSHACSRDASMSGGSLACDHDQVTSNGGVLRKATSRDSDAVLRLWASLFEDADSPVNQFWLNNAREWFTDSLSEPDTARFPVIEVAGQVVATAIGSIEIGVPNPWCPRGRTVRLANVFTRPSHRNQGFGTKLVLDVVDWARQVNADRVDLSATASGQRVYAKVGFVLTTAPRMKLVL